MASKILKGKNPRKPYTLRYWSEGRQRERSFVTRREATDFQAQFEHGTREGTYIDPRTSAETFGKAAERMIQDQPNANTREAYTGCLRHLTPILGRPLREVANDRDGIKALCANHAQGKRMLSVIRNTCDEAVNAGRLTGHRLAGLKANRIPGKRDLILATAEQVDQIATAMGKDGLAVKVMRGTGMRVSECLALRTTDFITTIDGNTVAHVSRQVQSGKIVPLKHRRDYSGRDVPVSPSLAALVTARPAGDLFTCSYRSFLERFTTAARKAGLPAGFTPHQLRHGFASTLLAGGIGITDVARWMGDEVRTVANIYAHLMPGQTDRALALLEDAAWPTGTRPETCRAKVAAGG
jgi:integrase